jgi:hypothetical protein
MRTIWPSRLTLVWWQTPSIRESASTDP